MPFRLTAAMHSSRHAAMKISFAALQVYGRPPYASHAAGKRRAVGVWRHAVTAVSLDRFFEVCVPRAPEKDVVSCHALCWMIRHRDAIAIRHHHVTSYHVAAACVVVECA